ncbi:NAD+ synthase [Candidatus Poribacteria bacterium]|nr:NAD+ synthase [Candidatus Poribacteria bacterium]
MNLRIAQAQINPTVGDLEGNKKKIINYIKQAQEAGADIVTFPELAVCGYPPEDLLLKPGFLRDTDNALKSIITASKGVTSVIGFADTDDSKVFNAAAVVDDGKLTGIYHKDELPNYGVFDEKRYFFADTRCFVFEKNDFRIAINICEDIWISGSLAERYAAMNNVNIALNISASPFHADKLSVRRQIVASFAERTGAYVCYNNLVGAQDELVFDGGSLVVSPEGKLVGCAKRFEEDLLITDFRVDESNTISVSSPCASELDRLEETYKALVLGTRDYVHKNGFSNVVIGLSGGIDSSLTAAVAVDALGKDHVMGVTMPSQYTSNETHTDAEILAENLGLRLITVPLQSIFAEYLKALEEPFKEGKQGLENENLQARIRGNILMALSNRFGWLVLTTGNKSEMAVGYCTLYGDMAGGFAVIKDVPKMLVYELSEYVNSKNIIIPESVIERPPSAELKPDQKDEDSLPPYAVLDPILQAYVEEDKSPAEIIEMGFDPQIVNEITKLVDRNEYKRRQAPPGVKITPKAFGRDRRLPITNKYLINART